MTGRTFFIKKMYRVIHLAIVFCYSVFYRLISQIFSGMLGTLCFEGVSMDPIMMASLVISIGFSVDIPAHVSYHFHSAGYSIQSSNYTLHI
jgi:hypothetical protein